MDENFENAREQAIAMFNEPTEETSGEPLQEEAPQVNSEENTPSGDTDMTRTTESAIATAEEAARIAGEKEQQLNALMQEVQAIRQENQGLQEMIRQMSQVQEEAIIENTIEEQPNMPMLDMNALSFADEETVRTMQEKYAGEMAEYVRSGVLKEMSPFLEQAKDGLYQKEKEAALQDFKDIPELSGMIDAMPQIERIIANNKWLQSDEIPIKEKYLAAFAMAKGINAMNTPPAKPKEPTAEELMAFYEKNPEFQNALEQKRLEDIKKGQQVPVFSASGGAANAALNIKDKPKNFEDARKLAMKYFGGR